MRRLAEFVTHRARATFIVSIVAVVVFALAGSHAATALKDGGFDDPNSDSSKVFKAFEDKYGGTTNLLFLVTPARGELDDAATATAGTELTAKLQSEAGLTVQSYWPQRIASLRARDGKSALIAITVPGNEADAQRSGERIIRQYAVSNDAIHIDAGGLIGANNEIGGAVQSGLAVAESVAIPITAILLIIAFGALVASLLPLLIGVIAIFGALAVLYVLGNLIDVSIYALNLTTAMGLGLAIDYALLIVSRFREERANGRDVHAAVRRTMETAGRTIVVSGLTVGIALAALLVFPTYFLRSFAYAGIATVAVAMLGAIVVLPAVLTLLGNNIDRWKVLGRPPQHGESEAWRRIASLVYRRPVRTALPVVVLLAVMTVPVFHVQFATPDDRVMQSGESRTVGDALRSQFAGDGVSTSNVVFDKAPSQDATIEYATRVSRIAHVDRVETAFGTVANGALRPSVDPQAAAALARTKGEVVRVVSASDPVSEDAQKMVRDIRAQAAPVGTVARLGGEAAQLVDGKRAISDALPWALALMVISTFLLLFLFTGSVLLPVKALLLNALTLGAVIGSMTWIFQDGHLSNLIGFTPMPLSTTMPVLLFCIAFGLSMDYEVFLLSRIKEAHEQGANNAVAVVHGLAATGRIVSTAAGLLSVTFFAFSTSDVSFMQFFGLGTGLAIVIDATLVRGVLVPAFMRLAGDANWWAPKPLKAIYARAGFAE